MQDALKQAIRAVETQQNSCPGVEATSSIRRRTKRRVVLTRFGRVEMPLKRLRCRACRQLFRPADRWLAQVQGHNVTPALREPWGAVGSSWPYETAAGVLKRLESSGPLW